MTTRATTLKRQSDSPITHLKDWGRKIRGKQLNTFIKTRKNRLKASYLKKVCSNEGDCLAFGTEIKRITKLFDNFTDFSSVKKISEIGEKSANGFIREFKYEKEGFTSYAILKSAIKNTSDNLASNS